MLFKRNWKKLRRGFWSPPQDSTTNWKGKSLDKSGLEFSFKVWSFTHGMTSGDPKTDSNSTPVEILRADAAVLLTVPLLGVIPSAPLS